MEEARRMVEEKGIESQLCVMLSIMCRPCRLLGAILAGLLETLPCIWSRFVRPKAISVQPLNFYACRSGRWRRPGGWSRKRASRRTLRALSVTRFALPHPPLSYLLFFFFITLEPRVE